MKHTLTLKREALTELTTDELVHVAAAADDSLACVLSQIREEVKQTFTLYCWTFNCTTRDAS